MTEWASVMKHKKGMDSDIEIDSAFGKMANDELYRKEALSLSREFEKSDSEALQVESLPKQCLTPSKKLTSMSFSDYVRLISQTHVRDAMNEIDRMGIPRNRRSKEWSVKDGDHLYPPKYLLSLASKIASGNWIPPNEHSGGEETNRVLQKLGFEIVPTPAGSNTKEG